MFQKANRSLLRYPLMRMRPMLGFYTAAATLSLSFICLLMSASFTWVPGVISTRLLNPVLRKRPSFTLIIRPIIWAIEQCGIVGVKYTSTQSYRFRYTRSKFTTFSCSRVRGYSGSLMCLMSSKISSSSYGSSKSSFSSAAVLAYLCAPSSLKASYNLGYGFSRLIQIIVLQQLIMSHKYQDQPAQQKKGRKTKEQTRALSRWFRKSQNEWNQARAARLASETGLTLTQIYKYYWEQKNKRTRQTATTGEINCEGYSQVRVPQGRVLVRGSLGFSCRIYIPKGFDKLKNIQKILRPAHKMVSWRENKDIDKDAPDVQE